MQSGAYIRTLGENQRQEKTFEIRGKPEQVEQAKQLIAIYARDLTDEEAQFRSSNHNFNARRSVEFIQPDDSFENHPIYTAAGTHHFQDAIYSKI